MDGGIFDPATISTMFAEFEQNLVQPEYWLSVLKIIWIDILLSGDNALVIALACRNLPDQQRKWGMILGAGAAVTLRVVFATIIVVLMTIPYLKLVGGLALLVIAAKLLVPDNEDEDVDAASNLLQAVWLIVLADVVMSLDNVIAIAAAADGSVSLLIFGLIVSIPLIIAGAALIVAVLDRLPVLVWAGAALLGWIAGHVIATDIAVEPYLHRVLKGQLTLTLDGSSALFEFVGKFVGSTDLGGFVMSVIGVIVVLVVGAIWRRNKLRELAALKTI
ncbi:MAG: TerC family protein [Xanthobacteraceae bacterium]